MSIVISEKFGSSAASPLRRSALWVALISAAALFSALPLAAQLPTLDVSKTASQTPNAPKTESSDSQPAISTKPPDIPVDQVIQKFGDREPEFKQERDNYTYTQNFAIQTIDFDGRPDGEYRMTSDITFTPEGKRYEKVISAPAPTLQRITLSQQDLDDLENVQPFVLTTDELPKYDVTYVGREKARRTGTYVFDVEPKKIEKNQRYFQGRIWVDDTRPENRQEYGKAVPDIIKKGTAKMFFRGSKPFAKISKAILVPHLHPLRRRTALQLRRRPHPHDRQVRQLQTVRRHHQDRPRRRNQRPARPQQRQTKTLKRHAIQRAELTTSPLAIAECIRRRVPPPKYACRSLSD